MEGKEQQNISTPAMSKILLFRRLYTDINLYSGPASGKTQLIISLCLSWATGHDWNTGILLVMTGMLAQGALRRQSA